MEHYTSGPDIHPAGAPSSLSGRTDIRNILNVLVLLGSIVIILSLSLEVFCDPGRYSGLYMQVQFWVCMIFLADFFYRLRMSPRKGRFVLTNFLFLLVSIPYLNIVNWFDLHVSQELYYWLRMVPLVRGGYGLAIVVGWTTRSRVTSLMVSYVLMIFALTYFTSLVFYTLEKPVNPAVDSFGNSLWWAFLNVTTVGARRIRQNGHRQSADHRARRRRYDAVPDLHGLHHRPKCRTAVRKKPAETRRSGRRIGLFWGNAFLSFVSRRTGITRPDSCAPPSVAPPHCPLSRRSIRISDLPAARERHAAGAEKQVAPPGTPEVLATTQCLPAFP